MFSENIRKWRCFENIDVPKISIFPKYRFPENIDFPKISMSRKSRCLENLDVPEISIIFSFEKMINSFEQSISEKNVLPEKAGSPKERNQRKIGSKTGVENNPKKLVSGFSKVSHMSSRDCSQQVRCLGRQRGGLFSFAISSGVFWSNKSVNS